MTALDRLFIEMLREKTGEEVKTGGKAEAGEKS